jgi:hypothetical protein
MKTVYIVIASELKVGDLIFDTGRVRERGADGFIVCDNFAMCIKVVAWLGIDEYYFYYLRTGIIRIFDKYQLRDLEKISTQSTKNDQQAVGTKQ